MNFLIGASLLLCPQLTVQLVLLKLVLGKRRDDKKEADGGRGGE